RPSALPNLPRFSRHPTIGAVATRRGFPTMSRRIAFVGLGIMGRPMARKLLKAGHRLVVYDLNPASVEELTAAGAARGASAQDAAARSDLIVTMLPDGPDVEKAILGPGGVLEGARRGAYVVDMSSI